MAAAAFAVLSVSGAVSASAQKVSGCEPCGCNPCECNAVCNNGCAVQCGDSLQIDRAALARDRMMQPFEGIDLTAQQKEDIQKINNEQLALRKAAGNDKAKGGDDRRQGRLEYLHKVQKVLTPEQYVTFLENTAVNGGRKMQAAGRKALKGAKAEGRKLRSQAGKDAAKVKAEGRKLRGEAGKEMKKGEGKLRQAKTKVVNAAGNAVEAVEKAL